MQADEQKDLETNSLVQSLSSVKNKIDGRTLYYILGTALLIVAGVLLFRYFSKQKTQARDAKVLQLETADTADKLKALMEEQRGTIFGSIAKLHMARRALTVDGLEKIGTDKPDDRKKAANSLDDAKKYFTDLTKEFKSYDEPAMLQEAWVGLAQAEEALVGLPTTEGGSDSRGDADKAIEAYTQAGSIFPDLELSKKYAARAKELKDDKAKFIEAQKAFYAAPPAPVIPIVKESNPVIPPVTKQPEPVVPPPVVKQPEPVVPPTTKLPDVPDLKKEPEPKKATEPEPKKVDPPKAK
ncbi:YfgM family protein [Zavarzinella formosa]|uniref:hypothetical protein n=1 Tax=Zavarzinella formosa TaxID=360055 RepID=UPI0002FDAAC6|nr:hypothetical protein [Zavarzinella formosa]